MDAYLVAQEIASAIGANRGVGHTTVMLNGIKSNPDATVIVHDEKFKETLAKMAGDGSVEHPLHPTTCSLSEVERGKLRGWHGPIAIDNAALQIVLSELLASIAVLREETKENKQTIEHMRDKLRLIGMILNK